MFLLSCGHRVCIERVNLPIWRETKPPVCVCAQVCLSPTSAQRHRPCTTLGSVCQDLRYLRGSVSVYACVSVIRACCHLLWGAALLQVFRKGCV